MTPVRIADRVRQHHGRIVCQRWPSTFPAGLPNAMARGERLAVLAMITGSVMIARVSEAERIE